MADRNVNHSTTDSSHAPRVPDPVQQNRPENGTELLPEHNGVPSATNVQRLAEIRARLDAVEMPAVEVGTQEWIDRCEAPWNADFFRAAPADIAWLLGEVERLRGEA